MCVVQLSVSPYLVRCRHVLTVLGLQAYLLGCGADSTGDGGELRPVGDHRVHLPVRCAQETFLLLGEI